MMAENELSAVSNTINVVMEVAVQVRIVWNQMRGVQLTRPSQRVAFGARLMRGVTWTEWEYFEFWHLHYLQVLTSNRIKLSAFIELKWPLFSMLQLVCWPLGGSGIGSWVGKCPCCTRNAAVLSAMPIPKVRLLALMVGLHVCALVRVRRSNIWEDALWAVKRTFDDKKHIHVTFLWESAMWPDLQKGTIIHIWNAYTYFKEAYFRYAMGNLSQIWVFYTGGVAAAITWK